MPTTLEKICSEADSYVANNQKEDYVDVIGIGEILRKAEIDGFDPINKRYGNFAAEYIQLRRDYLKKQKALSLTNWPRVVTYGWISGMIGLFYDTSPYGFALGALAGSGLTFYDEIKQKGINMLYVFLGTLAGPAFGLFFNRAGLDVSLNYIAGSIGTAIGLDQAFRKKKNFSAERYSKLHRLEQEYDRDKNELIKKYTSHSI